MAGSMMGGVGWWGKELGGFFGGWEYRGQKGGGGGSEVPQAGVLGRKYPRWAGILGSNTPGEQGHGGGGCDAGAGLVLPVSPPPPREGVAGRPG